MTRLHVLNAPGTLTFDEDALLARLEEAGGLEVAVSHDLAKLAEEIGDAEILYTNTKTDLGALRARAPALKWVQIISAGVETLLPTLPADLILANASGVHAEKGAEFVLASVLLLNYRIPAFQEKQRRHDWAPDFVRPLRGKRAVVLGSGAIGGAAIRLLAERGMEVIAVNRSGASRRDGRAFWNRWTGRRARSRIGAERRGLESSGKRIAARDPGRRTAGLHIRIRRGRARSEDACRPVLTRLNAPGILGIVSAAWRHRGKGT